MNVDEECLTVIWEPSKHKDHPELRSCRMSVLKAMNKMKIAVKVESTVGLKIICDRCKKSLTDQKFSLSDITSTNDYYDFIGLRTTNDLTSMPTRI